MRSAECGIRTPSSEYGMRTPESPTAEGPSFRTPHSALRILIAGGGTGGHVMPALAVAAELRRRGHQHILMVGTARGLEARLAPRAGVELETIEVGALKRVGVLRAVSTLLRLPRSFL